MRLLCLTLGIDLWLPSLSLYSTLFSVRWDDVLTFELRWSRELHFPDRLIVHRKGTPGWQVRAASYPICVVLHALLMTAALTTHYNNGTATSASAGGGEPCSRDQVLREHTAGQPGQAGGTEGKLPTRLPRVYLQITALLNLIVPRIATRLFLAPTPLSHLPGMPPCLPLLSLT